MCNTCPARRTISFAGIIALFVFYMNEISIPLYIEYFRPIDKRSIKIGTLRNVGTFPFAYIILKPFIPQQTCLYYK